MWFKHTACLLVASAAAAAAVAFVVAVSTVIYEMNWIEVCACMCLLDCVLCRSTTATNYTLNQAHTHTYEHHLLDAADVAARTMIHRIRVFVVLHMLHMHSTCVHKLKTFQANHAILGTDAHSQSHRLGKCAKQWTTNTHTHTHTPRNRLQCVRCWWFGEAWNKTCLLHPSKVEMQHVNYRCQQCMVMHFPFSEFKNSQVKIAEIEREHAARCGGEDQAKMGKKLAPKWHKRSETSQCRSRPWTQWTNK